MGGFLIELAFWTDPGPGVTMVIPNDKLAINMETPFRFLNTK